MSDKNVMSVHEEVNEPKKKSRKCKTHCTRFWWAYLIVLIIIAVLVPTLIIFVGVPKIAQKRINESTLEIQSVNISNTRSSSLRIEIESEISSSGSTSATISPFQAQMYLEDKLPHRPFLTLNMPSIKTTSKQIININQDFEIKDMDAFATYNTWFSSNESLWITIDGDTTVRPSGLNRDFDVDYKKTYQIKGLNKLKGLDVVESDLTLGTKGDEPNFTGAVQLPNPSKFTIEIGNATFLALIDDEEIGMLNVTDIVLRPGGSRAEVVAHLDLVKVLDKVQTRPYCQDGILPFTLACQSVVNHGELLPYFTRALGSSNQTVKLDVGSIAGDSFGIDISCD